MSENPKAKRKQTAKRLDWKIVAAAIRGDAATGRLADGEGLYLRVRAEGAYWVFISAKGVKRTEISLGSASTLGDYSGSTDPKERARKSLEMARQKAAEIRQKLVEGQSILAMRGSGAFADKEATLEDVLKKYCDLKKIEDGSKAKGHCDRVFKSFSETVMEYTKSTKLRGVTKFVADKWATERLKSVSYRSVVREIALWKSMFNNWIKATDADIKNPFVNLMIPKPNEMELAKAARKPMPKDVIKQIIDNMSVESKYNELSDLFKVLACTGARLAEITKLRVIDVQLDEKIPHIVVEQHEERSVKNIHSERAIVIYEPVISILKKRLAETNGECVFPKYGGITTNMASKALGAQIRLVTSDKKIVTHSLRHAMTDYLRENKVRAEVENSLLGHTNKGVARESYGSKEGDLREQDKWLSELLPRYLE